MKTLTYKDKLGNIKTIGASFSVKSPTVTQSTGQSPDMVMSQKAVTDELENIKDNVISRENEQEFKDEITKNVKDTLQGEFLTRDDLDDFVTLGPDGKISADLLPDCDCDSGSSTPSTPSIEVSQSTGQSTSATMSQKAITDELQKLQTTFESYPEDDDYQITIDGSSNTVSEWHKPTALNTDDNSYEVLLDSTNWQPGHTKYLYVVNPEVTDSTKLYLYSVNAESIYQTNSLNNLHQEHVYRITITLGTDIFYVTFEECLPYTV